MKRRTTYGSLLLVLLLLACGMPGFAQDSAHTPPTADQQQNARSDREVTQQIRKAIVEDASLSVDAHNLKVVTQDGTVTMQGLVRSDEEKRVVEARAAEIAGEINLISELTVKTNN